MIDNIAIQFFGIKIYWYGLVYFFGILISYYFFLKLDKFFNIKKNVLEDIFFYTIIFGIIGARFFQVVFYSPSFYLTNPEQILYFSNGGMSIYGALFFSSATLYFLSKKHKFNFFKISDFGILFLTIFLILGRIANFLNREIPGIITNQDWGSVYYNHDTLKRIPITLFESLKELILFNILFYLKHFKKVKKGLITLIFVFFYSFFRFFLEFFKDTKSVLFFLSTNQIFSILFFILGIIIYKKLYNKKES